MGYDDPDIRQDLADILRDEGYEVITATNGQEARDRLQSPCALPDLIILDLMMPVMNGWQFRAAQLKDVTLADIPVIVLSAAGDMRREARALGAAEYLAKPFNLHALLRAIHRSVSAS